MAVERFIVVACLAFGASSQLAARSSLEEPVYSKAELAAVVQVQRKLLSSFSVSWTMSDDAGHPWLAPGTGFFAVAGPTHWRSSLEYFPEPGDDPLSPGLTDSSANGVIAATYWSQHGWATVAPTPDIPKYGGEHVPGAVYLRFLMHWPAESPTGYDCSPRDLLRVLEAANSTLRSALEPVDGRLCHVVDLKGVDGAIYGSLWLDASQGCLPLKQVWGLDGERVFEIHEVLAIGDAYLPARCTARSPNGLVEGLEVRSNPDGTRLVSLQPTAADLPADPLEIVPAGASVNDMLNGSVFVAHAGDVRGRAREIAAAVGDVDIVSTSPIAMSESEGGGVRFGVFAWSAVGLSLGLIGGVGVGTRFWTQRRLRPASK
jgi:hypothetical protein